MKNVGLNFWLENAIQSFYVEGVEFNKQAWDWYSRRQSRNIMKNAKDPYTKKRNKWKPYRVKFEYDLAKQIERAGYDIYYEAITVNYTVPTSNHKYTPDFILPKRFKDFILVEAKGRMTLEMRKKYLYIKQSRPELDLRFVFLEPTRKIRKGSKTTYAQWAEKNGFLWSDKEIPDSWFHEASSVRTLDG